ncbi:MAG: hypothetical protein HZB62_10600 [Nitrospirae bacterium]|nr:hypothetical protein [Nitrospirota bacterium]
MDENLEDLSPVQDDFLADFANLMGDDSYKIKYLSADIAADSAVIKDNELYYQGKHIPMSEIPAYIAMREEQHKDQLAAQKKEADKHAKGLEGQLKESASEKKALLGRVKELEPFEPKDLDKAAIDTFDAVDNHLRLADNILRAFAFKTDDLSDDAVARINSILNRMKDRVEMFDQNWTAQLTGDE